MFHIYLLLIKCDNNNMLLSTHLMIYGMNMKYTMRVFLFLGMERETYVKS